MKNKLAFLGIFAAFAALLFFAPSFTDGSKADENKVVTEVTAGGEYQATGTTLYQYTYTKDTITNAANDTLYLPATMRPVISDFLIGYTITRTNISGTTNLAVKVEESAYRYTGSTPPTAGWVTSINNLGGLADSDATTATEESIRIPNAYGQSYRIIIDGTGTQSSSYTVRVVLKRKT